MTPKEKAKELVGKFEPYSNEGLTSQHREILIDRRRNAKQCALIAVDEILKDYTHLLHDRNVQSNQVSSSKVYWQEVKQEIKSL